MMLFGIKIKYYIISILIYIILYGVSIFFIMNYEDNYIEYQGSLYSYESMEVYELIFYILYKYILAFPLGIIGWFESDLMYLNGYFVIPNAFMVSYLVVKLKDFFNNTFF